jgi:hypothetical protein
MVRLRYGKLYRGARQRNERMLNDPRRREENLKTVRIFQIVIVVFIILLFFGYCSSKF